MSGGSRSINRFEHTANLLSVVQTCRRQKRSVINFFEQALMAKVGACSIPTLIIYLNALFVGDRGRPESLPFFDFAKVKIFADRFF